MPTDGLKSSWESPAVPSLTVATAAHPVSGAVTTWQLADQVPSAACQLVGGKFASLNCSFRNVNGVSAAAFPGRRTPTMATVVTTTAMTASRRRARDDGGPRRWSSAAADTPPRVVMTASPFALARGGRHATHKSPDVCCPPDPLCEVVRPMPSMVPLRWVRRIDSDPVYFGMTARTLEHAAGALGRALWWAVSQSLCLGWITSRGSGIVWQSGGAWALAARCRTVGPPVLRIPQDSADGKELVGRGAPPCPLAPLLAHEQPSFGEDPGVV